MNVSSRLASLLLLLAAPLPAFAQEVPLLIQCQGRLSDGSQPMNGEVQMILRLYDQPQGGTLRYEDSSNVRLLDGMYSTYLGDHTTSGSLKDALASGPLWLEVIANGTVFTPRERLAAVPFAVMAENVRKGSVNGDTIASQSVRPEHLTKGAVGIDALADNVINSAKIIDGTVTGDDIADGTVTPPKLSMSYWTTKGNLNEGGDLIFLGTLDPRPVDIRVNNRRGFRLEPNPVTPILVGGHEVNDSGKNAAGAVIGGGGQPSQPNRVDGEFSVVDGGAGNTAKGPFSVVGGGLDNLAAGNRAVVGGGRANQAEGPASTIAGGFSNRVANSFSFIGGGHANAATGYVAAIAGGWGNNATGQVAVVAGGQENRALGDASAVGGGWMNQATGYATVVGGGRANKSEGPFAVIGGGTNNVARGLYAVVPGGRENSALGEASFAAGSRARAAHPGSFVWSDGGKGPFSTTGDNQFLIRAAGNVGIDTSAPEEKLTVNGNVKAAKFIGDGSALTGVTAGTLADGSVGDAQIKAAANIAPAKIAGEALTKKTAFGGAVEGTADNLALKKGAVGQDHLAPGLIALALADSELAKQVKKIQDDTAKLQAGGLARDLVLGGDVTGGVARVELRPGVVGEAELAPGVIEKLIAASALARQVGALGTAKLDASAAFAGDVTGVSTNLQIKAGTVGPDELMPGLVENAIAASPLNAEVTRIKALGLTNATEFKGDVAGTAAALALRDGVVLPKHLSKDASALFAPVADVQLLKDALPQLAPKADVQAIAKELSDADAARRKDLAALSQRLDVIGAPKDVIVGGVVTGKIDNVVLRDGVVEPRHLAAGIWDDLKSTQGLLTEAVGTLSKQALSLNTPLGGDVAGTPANIQIKAGVIGSDKLADGSVTRAKLAPALVAELNAVKLADGSVGLNLLAPEVKAAFTPKPAPAPAPGSIGLALLAPEVKDAFTPKTPAPGSVGLNLLAPEVKEAFTPKPTPAPAPGSIGLALLAPEVKEAFTPKPVPAPAPGSIGLALLAPEVKDAFTPKPAPAPAPGSIGLNLLSPEVKEAFTPKPAPGLADGAVTTAKLADGAVTVAKLSPGLVADLKQAEIPDLSVTTAKLAPDVRNALQRPLVVADGSIGLDKLTKEVVQAIQKPAADNKGGVLQPDGSARMASAAKKPVSIALGNETVWSAQAGTDSPNLIAGSPANLVAAGLSGAAIHGGGSAAAPNKANADFATIGGGFGNKVTGFDGTIGGGQDNTAGGTAATIGGGFLNATEGLFPVIAGGAANQARANLATIGGGFSNKVTGAYAVIPGGYQNEAAGDYSLAAGRNARAAHGGSFVWADSTNAALATSDRNQFMVRASGGVWFFTSPDLASGVKLNPGSGSWSMLSDRAAKDNLRPVDGRETLEKLAAVPVYNWNYKTQDEGVRHVGPTSQDFSAAFGVGEDAQHISTVDAHGVALSAIQGLYAIVQEKDEAIRKLEEQNARLLDRLDAIEKKLGGN